MGKLGDKKVIPLLINLLNDFDQLIRQSAAEALGNLGGKKAVKPLIQLFNDPFMPTRLAAIEALEKLDGCKQAIGPLTKLVEDPDIVVSFKASQILNFIK